MSNPHLSPPTPVQGWVGHNIDSCIRENTVHILTKNYGHSNVHVLVHKISSGHSSMKQYVPKKPIHRGFKVLVVADSSSAYSLDVDMYVGKASDGVTTEHGLSESCSTSHRAVQTQKPYSLL